MGFFGADRIGQISEQVEQIKTQNTKLQQAEESFILGDKPQVSDKQIQAGKQQLASDIEKLKTELFNLLGEKLTIEKSGLGSSGFRELKQWHQDILDTEELIELDPQLKQEYGNKLQEQRETWLQVPQEAKSDSNSLYSIMQLERQDLASIRNEIAPKLIEPRQNRINEIKKQLPEIERGISDQAGQRRNLVRGGRDTSSVDAQLNPLVSERARLRAEQTQLNNEIDRIKTLQQRITPNAEEEKFADNASVNDVWNRLTRNHEDGNESSTKKLANVLIAQKIVNGENEMIDYLKTLKFQGRSVSDVRREFKDHYRPQLLQLIYSQPTSELRYRKMREIAENLDVQGQGSISEDWYQEEFRRGANPQVPNTTQATLGTLEAKTQYGIELSTKDNRRFDELFGDENSATIREHKHVSGKLGADQIAQFEDNIKIVRHNRDIDEKIAGGEPLSKSPQDTPVIIEKDGKKFRPKQVLYTFATPEGVKSNANWMGAELGNNKEYLSFEIINNKGQRKTIDITNIRELKEPALSQWLEPP